MSLDELRQMREEITALRLSAQANQNRVLARLEDLEKLLVKRTAKPGWGLYGLLATATVLGWIVPR
ncbi:hypothetical protein [Meiothermus sp.]|uniref:hypothetical protein n=1 Tax=Meiothermus sp. TaxID=1955249 RepID=UPI00307D431B